MMFKDGTAAAIINGPWAWAGYGEAGINYGLTRIPYMTETGNWCSPLVSAKGYSVNTNLAPERVQYVRQVLEYLTDASIQTRMAEELATIPVIASVRESPEFKNNDFLQASLRQLEVGKAMPMAPQLRQVWDGMRGPYQLVMNGAVTAEEGARLMQAEVEKRIADAFL
jgi:maltose-binding protein MalE